MAGAARGVARSPHLIAPVSLRVHVTLRQGDFRLDAAIATDARVVAVFGPSGAGKSTLLHVIAGLIRTAAGHVEIDGMVLQDTPSHVFVPAHRRSIGYVFQEGRLFPHMNVRQNLLYGRRFRRGSRPLAAIEEVAELLGIAHLMARGPASLSGGEQQRVALARALLSGPKILLLDEPLAALDDARKNETLPYIERLRDAFSLPIVYVSHSRAEVDRIADEVVHMAGGRMVT